MKFKLAEGSNVKIPTRSTVGSCGYDFYMPYDVELKPFETKSFNSGVKVDIDEGYFLALYPRSSIGIKGIMITNTVGIIDSDYEGEILATLTNNTMNHIELKKGERYMQGIFQPYAITDDDNTTGERVGGLGSTGK